MAIPEFIGVLRKIRDVIYPKINELYNNSFDLNESIDIGRAEFNTDLTQFNTDYSDFNIKKTQIDASVLSASNSELSASQSAQTATNKSNEIKAITAQSTTGAPGTSASASYNPTDGKFTFNIPQGSKGEKGESFTVNSSGATAQRTLYDTQPVGWSFLDVATSLLYFKVSSTSGDWSSGVPFGKGDKGDAGGTGVGIVSFTFISTTDMSGLPAQSGATDTYRVTLANDNVFDYKIHNGLDYSNELLDTKLGTKLDKNFSNFAEKVAPADTDILAIQEVGGLFKKLKWANLKATLKTYFDTLYLTSASSQTISGTTTFAVSPIVPTPTTGTQAANKDYVDLQAALTNFKGENQSLASSGYQKLPGGLIIQWGIISLPQAGQTTIYFSISFPTSCLVVTANGLRNIDDSSAADTYFKTKSKSNAILDNSSNPAQDAMYIAIGY